MTVTKEMVEALREAYSKHGQTGDLRTTPPSFECAEAILTDALAATPGPVVEKHHDDIAVDRFAVAMKANLAKKRDEGRGGWEDKSQCSNEFLSRLLLDHVEKGDPVDVGNIAMMIHQRDESINVLTERVGSISQLHAIVDAWEALPGGRQVRNRDVEKWLAEDMAPAINAIRGFLRRRRPDGVLPPIPESAITPATDMQAENERLRAFSLGDHVMKRSGSWWEGRVVGFYSTEQTPDGVCVQLDKQFGPVQIYPSAALERKL